MVSSGSSPTSRAYDRTNARLKIPPGRREMSLRSSASSALTEIFVVLAISRSDMPRRSRASRSLLPKPPGAALIDIVPEAVAMLGSRFHAVKLPAGRFRYPDERRGSAACLRAMTDEHAHRRDASGGGARNPSDGV